MGSSNLPKVMHISWKEIKRVSLRLAKGCLNIQCHVKLIRNTSPTELQQQEKVMVFSSIEESTISKIN